MRSSKSRSRSKTNRNRNNNNSLGNVVNRVFDSSGPDGKVRGTPQQIIEKYNQLARDAALGNDRVAAENFQQHAEHYLRLLGAAQREQDQRREQQERENRDRQAQRDRERAERVAAQGGQPSAPVEVPQPAVNDPAMAEQPDVLAFDVADEDNGPGLVDTPESKSEKPAKAAEPAAEPAPAPEAEAKPQKPRAPRKPRKKATEAPAEPVADAAPPQADAAE